MTEFFQVRLQYYDMRKVHLTKKLTEEWEKLDNKVSCAMRSRARENYKPCDAQ